MVQKRRSRHAALAASLAVCLAMTAMSAPAAQAGPLRQKFLSVINRVRVNHDLEPIRLNRPLSEDAKAHTRKMIRRGVLFDPRNLSELLDPYRWTEVGADVVGCHDSLNKLVRLWMGEHFHRSIVLHPGLKRAGVAVIRVEGKSACGRAQVWATAIMYG